MDFCPNSLLNNWEIELNNWAPQFQVKRFTGGENFNNNIILVPYSSMGKLLQVIDPKKLTIDVVVTIADESHKLRNSGSGIHNAFKKIKRDRNLVSYRYTP